MSRAHGTEHLHHNPGSRGVLLAAIVAFGLLGTMQVGIGVLFGRVALAVDGAHNLADVPALWLNRVAQHHAVTPRQRAWIALISAASSVVASAVFLLAESGDSSHSEVPLAVALSITSVAVNGVFAHKLHRHSHDLNSRMARRHLYGDMASSLLAVFAYTIILLTNNAAWLDTAAATAGVVIIAVVHVGPAKQAYAVIRAGDK